MRSSLQILFVAGVFCVIATIAPGASEIVIAVRYLQAKGTSHSHLYLYREDGKLLRQLTKDDSGQDSAPIFSPDGETIVFNQEKSNNVREFWSVKRRGTDVKKLDAAPDWYAQAKSSPYFTNVEPQEAGSADATSSPAESVSPAATPVPTYKSPDGLFELILREDPNDKDDQIDGPGHGKHFVLWDLKTGTETELSRIPGFYCAFELLHDNQDENRRFLFDGPLRLAFFDLHLNSTDGDTVFALDLTGPRLVRLLTELGYADSAAGRTRLSHIHGKPLRSYPREQEDGELLLHRALGREAESHSLRTREIRRVLLRNVDVSARSYAGGDHVAPKLGVRSEFDVILSEAKNLGSNLHEFPQIQTN